jgi:hypothetical protein
MMMREGVPHLWVPDFLGITTTCVSKLVTIFLVLWLFFDDSCPFPEASFVSVVEGRNERGSRDFQEKTFEGKSFLLQLGYQ